jgi:hypothetical protein
MSIILFKISFIIFMVLFHCSYSYSIDWVYIGESKGEPVYRYFIDCDSLSMEGNRITYWSKEVNIEIGEIRKRTTADCTEHFFRISEIIVFDSNGLLSQGDLLDEKVAFNATSPDTMLHIQKLLLCDENNYPREDLKIHIKGYESILLRERKNP